MDGQEDSSAAPANKADSRGDSKGDSKGIVEANGRREWIPKNRPAQTQTQAPERERREWVPSNKGQDFRSPRSSSSSSYDDPYGSGGGGGFGEYDSFAPSRPSQSSRPATPRDRDDSERILDELLKDLDMGKGKGGEGGGLDVFDFSDDDEDDRSRGGNNRGAHNQRSGGSPPAGARTTSGAGAGAGAGAGVVSRPARSASTGSAPRMEDFASFEQYLDALVNHERSSLSTSPQQRKPLRSADADSLDDDILDLLGDDSTPRAVSGVDNRSRDSLNPNRSWSPRSGGSGSIPVKDPEADWETSTRRRQEDAYSSRSMSSGSSSGGGGVDNSDGYDDDLDSFLNSLEVSNVLSTTKSKLKEEEKVEKNEVMTEKSETTEKAGTQIKEDRVVTAAASSDTKQKEIGSLSASGEEPSFAEMTVKALKDKLRGLGLPVSGTKPELLNRLRGR